jgi:hypothetical protein
MKLNINSDAVVQHTNTLEKMHRSALPSAIRSTLNSVAFDVKKNTMPASAEREFTQRAPNFFKANSRVEMARGWNVDQMKAIVGFIPKDQAVEDLEQQEYGGTIEGRSFIPMDQARAGGPARKVRPSNRITKIGNVVNASTMEGRTPQAKFLAAARKAGKGGYVLGNLQEKTLWKIEAIDGRNIRKKPLFSYEKNRDVSVSATGFMRTASLESANQIEKIFIREAEKQFERLRK